jgi:predicted transcriptional regulator
LKEILVNFYQYNIEEFTPEQQPDLKSLRSIFNSKTSKLLINSTLSSEQKAFTYGREIGYQYLQIKNRSYISSVIEAESFEQVLNNFRASYFARAILINKNILIDRLTYFFASPKWDADMLLNIMRLFSVTPEVFMHRISNVMTSHFNIKNLFFLRFNNQVDDNLFYLTKEMHLAKLHTPHGTAMNEHYCRRWISLTILKDLEKLQKKQGYKPNELICDAQISEYIDTENNYLVISLAKPSPPGRNTNSSITLGFAIDDNLKSIVNFLSDSSLIHRKVNETCERCGLTNCEERVVEPVILKKRLARQKLKEMVSNLTS